MKEHCRGALVLFYCLFTSCFCAAFAVSVGGEESRFGFLLIKRSEIVKTKGLDNITAEDLVAEITPTGRGAFYFYLARNSM